MSNAEVFEKVVGGYRMPSPDNCPKEIYEWMFACWKVEPEQRPSFKQHRWFHSICLEIHRPMFGVLTMALCLQGELLTMSLPSWMVVCIPLEEMMGPIFPHTWLPPFVECMPSVDHVMMRINAISMTPVKAMANVLEPRSALQIMQASHYEYIPPSVLSYLHCV